MTAKMLKMSAQGKVARDDEFNPPMAPPSASTWLKNRIIMAKAPALGATDK